MISNYHTHTTFCDGADTPEELVQEAIRLGCPELGFSGHSYVPFDAEGGMSEENTIAYKKCITSLKEKYAGQIRILLGVEQDFFSPAPTEGYDYVIGSVHYVKKDGEYLPVDLSRESFINAVETHYGGDYYGIVEDYYALVSQVYEKTHCQIISHFDLITKFNEGNALFDTQHPRYVGAVVHALEDLLPCPVQFEINTGAMARGYRTEPYPESWILEVLVRNQARIISNSDCHDKKYLLYGL